MGRLVKNKFSLLFLQSRHIQLIGRCQATQWRGRWLISHSPCRTTCRSSRRFQLTVALRPRESRLVCKFQGVVLLISKFCKPLHGMSCRVQKMLSPTGRYHRTDSPAPRRSLSQNFSSGKYLVGPNRFKAFTSTHLRCVYRVGCHQLFVRALLGDFAVIEHNNAIGVTNR